MKAAKNSSDTPVMRQYLAVKAQHPDAVVLFRMGDFYETFFEDAVTIAPVLGITLTTRDRNAPDPVPMAGVPYHAVGGYVRTLLERGFKVAVCEQVETPEQARRRKGPNLVRREVVRVLTPGVRIDEDHLAEDRPNFLAAVVEEDGCMGLAALDVSTGDFLVAETGDPVLARACLVQWDPSEVLAESGEARVVEQAYAGRTAPPVSKPKPAGEAIRAAVAALAEDGGIAPLGPGEASAAARVYAYAVATQPRHRLLIHRLRRVPFGRTLWLDEVTLRNLEVLQNLRDGGRKGTLLWAVDETRTPQGARLLREWLSAPACDRDTIVARLDAVEALVAEPRIRRRVRSALRDVRDVARIAARARLDAVTPRQLGALRDSLAMLPVLAGHLDELGQRRTDGAVPEALSLGEDLLEDLAGRLRRTLVDDPPASAKDGGVIRPGADPELDRLRALREGGRKALADMEARERQRTGIASLKVQHNRVFGYYIEVPKTHAAKVPEDYARKQTLASVERYVTEELAQHESQVLEAQEGANEREREILGELRAAVADAGDRICRVGEALARVDVLSGFAEVAAARDFVRPDVCEAPVLEVEEGRHPVVERIVGEGAFVPNDVQLRAQGVAGPGGAGARLWLVTGPNMGGKSTVMRQAALLALLAHAGSFVPARRARVGLVDRIFTRVGASDDLGGGRSTFMVEMVETARILASAGPRSLVIVDELGRGTATYDGLALAWAVLEFLHDQVGCRTLFATHYHELCNLADRLPGAANVHVTVHERQGDIVFLHRLAPGPSGRSYGIQVGRLAGLPRRVLSRARRILEQLETSGGAGGQMGLFEAPPAEPARSDLAELSALRDELADIDPDDLSPRQAHDLLRDLARRARRLGISQGE